VAQIEVVTYLPAKVGVCRVCDLTDAFRIQLREETWDVDLSALMQALEQVDAPVRFTSPFSLRGLYLMIRHGTGKLPLVIVGGGSCMPAPSGSLRNLLRKYAKPSATPEE
jgi:hypothetical protein